eukprot:860775_1
MSLRPRKTRKIDNTNISTMIPDQIRTNAIQYRPNHSNCNRNDTRPNHYNNRNDTRPNDNCNRNNTRPNHYNNRNDIRPNQTLDTHVRPQKDQRMKPKPMQNNIYHDLKQMIPLAQHRLR